MSTIILRALTLTKYGIDTDTLAAGSGQYIMVMCSGCGKTRRMMRKLVERTAYCKACALEHQTPEQKMLRQYNPSVSQRVTAQELKTHPVIKRTPCAMCSEPHSVRTDAGVLLCGTHSDMYYSLKNTINSRQWCAAGIFTGIE